MLRVFALLALVAVPVGVTIGCGSSSDDGGSTSASAVTSKEDAGDAAPLDECAPCSVRYAAGAATYEDARHRCFCADDVCHSACAGTECNPRNRQPANDACTSCINDSYSKCIQAVQAACEADQECTRFVVCELPGSCRK